MWWALAAAAIPYVMQSLQGQPDQPRTPPQTIPGDETFYKNQLMSNAFNPQSKLFTQASDTVNEQVQRNLAKAGLAGSSAGAAMTANTQSELANKWLTDQTSRQNAALQTANSGDASLAQMREQFANDQYQYGAAGYNRNNAYNSGQVAGVGGAMQGMMNAYGNYQTGQTMQQNALAYQRAMEAMRASYGTPSPTGGYGDMGAPVG